MRKNEKEKQIQSSEQGVLGLLEPWDLIEGAVEMIIFIAGIALFFFV